MNKIALGSRPAKQEIKAYTDVLQFGKHKGHTVDWILAHAPDYILWLDENGWTVDGQIILYAEDMVDAELWDEYDTGRFPNIWDYIGDEDY